MKKAILLVLFLFIGVIYIKAQAPVAGIYQQANLVVTGANTVIIPISPATNATGAIASTSANFKGQLLVEPLTGNVMITNAYPAGNYTITVKVFNTEATAISTFTITISNPPCSQGLFSTSLNTAVGNLPFSAAIGDFNKDGKQDIVTTSYANNTVSVQLGNGTGSFSGMLTIPVGTGPQSVAIGDFNADGKQDLAVANFAGFNVSILLGDGAGGFSSSSTVSVGNYPYAIAVADFNQDGKTDLATADYGSNKVSIRLGNGLGGFSGTTNVNVGVGPRSLAIADFNGDGKPDLVTANYTANTASVRLGNGAGAFSGITELAVGNNPHGIAAADLNADGKADIAVANYNSNTVSVRLGNGAGGFSNVADVPVGANPRAVAIADLNGDGKPDLATANISANTVSIRLGTGNGLYIVTAEQPVGVNPFDVIAGDLNADGRPDLVTANAGNNNASVLLGNINEIEIRGNNNSIAAGSTIPSLSDHTDFGDVSNNLVRSFTIQNTGAVNLVIKNIIVGGADTSLFVVSATSLPFSLAPGSSTSFTVSFTPVSAGLKTASVQVINDDCDEAAYSFAVQGTAIPVLPTLGTYPATVIQAASGNTIVTPSAAPTNAGYITASASSGFKGQLSADPVSGAVHIVNAYPAGTYTITVRVNGVATATSSFSLTVNNTNCSQALFGPATNLATGNNPYALSIADLNGDGKQDIVSVNRNSADITVQLGNAAGGFTGMTVIAAGADARALAIADINGDGKPDLAIANGTANRVSVLFGDGAGNFGGMVMVPVGNNPRSIAIADFNGDGKPDLATANYGSNNVSILLGNGYGSFIGTMEIPVGTNPASIIAGDFDTDGNQDIATANYNSNNLSIRFGDGTGAFTGTAAIAVGSNPTAMVSGDFDRDGKQDIATANYTGSNISVRFGDGMGDFTGTTEIPVDANPAAISTGDFNADGKPDLVTASNTANTVSVRLGNGTGGFSVATTGSLGNSPRSIATGDFNNDGRQDIAAANSAGNNISVLLGAVNNISVQGNNTVITAGDNTPSVADHTDFENVTSSLVRTFSIQNTGAVSLKINNILIDGNDAQMFSISDINLPISIAAGNTDSFAVRFTPTGLGLKTARVIISNDNCELPGYDFSIQGTGYSLYSPTLGTYPATTINTAGGNTLVIPSAMPANADYITAYTTAGFKGLLDVDPVTGYVHVINAHPAGTYPVTVKVNGISTVSSSFILTVNNTHCSKAGFLEAPAVAVGNLPFAVAVGDFNGDGKQDLVSANYAGNSASIRLGNGIGGFNGTTNIPVGINPYSIAIGDFNGDGKQDFAVANHGSNNVSVLLGDGAGGISSNATIAVGPLPATVSIGDFNADGKPDLAVVNTGNGIVSIRFGDGSGNFNGNIGLAVGSGAFSIAVADFNGDGKDDIASANYNVDNVTVHLGDGMGGFTTMNNVPVGINPYSITTGDFNGDGKQDLATANYFSNNISVRLGDGAGNFTATADVVVGTGPGSIVTGDFNGDAKPDLAIANYTSNSIAVCLGNGDGAFNLFSNIQMTGSPYALAIGDFNADGMQDMAAANNNNNISIWLGIETEISVQGNGISIVDGASTATAADHTDFGTGNNVTSVFNIQNTGTVDLVINNIFAGGTDAPFFTVSGMSFPANIAPGAVMSFTVNFSPLTAGVKKATVHIINDDCDEGDYDFAVRGEYECQQLVVGFTGLATAYCSNAPVITLNGNPAPGGIFTGTGITDHADGTALFDPLAAGIGGPYSIGYTYTNGQNGCTYNYTQEVVIYALPVVNFSGLAVSYCTTDAPVTLTGNHPAGSFSSTGPGLTDNGDGTAVFDPSQSSQAGTYSITYSYTNENGCSATISQPVLLTVCPTYITLDMKLFLEGLYRGAGTMASTLYDLEMNTDPTAADLITVNLWSPVNLGNQQPDHSITALLHTDGTATMQFPIAVNTGLFYIAVRHRNHMETWSKDPVLFSGNTIYDFSTALTQAYDDGVNPSMVNMMDGVYAFYGGDVNQDGGIDASDLGDVDNDNNVFAFGYNATDVNGDGGTDASDLAIIDNNSQLFLFYARPY